MKNVLCSVLLLSLLSMPLYARGQSFLYNLRENNGVGVQAIKSYEISSGDKTLVAECYYNSAGQLTVGRSYNMGRLNTLDSSVYDTHGQLREKFSIDYHYYDGKPYIWNNITYDAKGNLLGTLYMSRDMCSQETHVYNAEGERIHSSVYFNSGGLESHSEMEIKNNETVLLQTEYLNGEYYSTTREINNTLLHRYEEHTIRADGKKYKRIVQKDKQGRDLEIIRYENGKKSAHFKYRYKEGKKGELRQVEKGKTGNRKTTREQHQWYDQWGELEAKHTYISGKLTEKSVYRRDSLKNLLESSHYNADSLNAQMLKEFDEKNRLVKESEFKKGAKYPLKTESYVFDENDNRVGYTLQYHPADGKELLRFDYRYQYDAAGNWTTLEIRKNDEPHLALLREIEYRE